MPSPSEIPDFSQWSRSRLLFLLDEYQKDLASIRALFGPKHAEYVTHIAWIKAIEEELQKREV
jgi:hypothetical protein